MCSESPARTWIDAVHEYARGERVPTWVLDDLATFVTAYPRGGPPHPPEKAWEDDFPALEAELAFPLDVGRVTRVLTEDTEGRQPAMFARRVAAVEGLLADLAVPAARILRVGLRMRLRGMCDAPAPRLHRVRALADFYYSLAARLRNPEWVEHERHLEDLIEGMSWREVREGLEHALIDGFADGMPIHVNLLRVDPTRVKVEVADLQGETRTGRPLAEILAGRACAAISGGYFLYSEDDIEAPSRRHDPVGLLLTEGTVVSPPVFRRAGFLMADGAVDLRLIGMGDVEVRIGGVPVALKRTWNRADAEMGPDDTSLSIVGDRVLAIGREIRVPLNGFVATLAGELPVGVRAGTHVQYGAPRVAGRPAHAGLCGGPLLVRDGQAALDMRAEDFWASAPPITFSQDETGDRNLLARMALGLDREGRLLAAAIDGRNVRRALGMTLSGVARLMIQLGCERAINLDGGSSKRMYLEGRIVDLPSTEIVAGESAVTRVRPLHTAILFQA